MINLRNNTLIMSNEEKEAIQRLLKYKNCKSILLQKDVNNVGNFFMYKNEKDGRIKVVGYISGMEASIINSVTAMDKNQYDSYNLAEIGEMLERTNNISDALAKFAGLEILGVEYIRITRQSDQYLIEAFNADGKFMFNVEPIYDITMNLYLRGLLPSSQYETVELTIEDIFNKLSFNN